MPVVMPVTTDMYCQKFGLLGVATDIRCQKSAVPVSSARRNHGTKRLYGVATISRLLQIIGLFCKRALYKSWYSAKDIYSFKEPTSSHPIPVVTGSSPLCSVNTSRYTYEWDMSHMCTSHVTHMNESCHVYECVM